MTMKHIIAIIGGGFAGTMLAVQLAMRSSHPLQILLYDQSGAFARGTAYGTRNPAHLLNVPAGRMGAFADKIGDFQQWLESREYRTSPQDFMPRALYGDYLESLLAGAQDNSNHVTIETVAAGITGVDATKDGITLTLADGSQRSVSQLALALGSLPTQAPHFKGTLSYPEHYVGNVWAPPENSILRRADTSAAEGPVLIIGTGLTMIDMVLSLRGQGYKGKIIAVSRNGLTPQPHAQIPKLYPRFLSPETAPHTAIGLLRAVRAEAKNKDWRAIIESLRDDTPALWAGLSEKQRRRFLRVLSFWNVHRHRMPQSSALMIEKEVKAGTLSILAGNIHHIEEVGDRLVTYIRRKGTADTVPLSVDHVLNCAGPITDIRKGSGLLASMMDKGLIQSGPLRMGIAADTRGNVKGSVTGRIFALGPLLVGERLETIAVPELRQQAEEVATSLLTSLSP